MAEWQDQPFKAKGQRRSTHSRVDGSEISGRRLRHRNAADDLISDQWTLVVIAQFPGIMTLFSKQKQVQNSVEAFALPSFAGLLLRLPKPRWTVLSGILHPFKAEDGSQQ